jgi:hypothetical protein
VILLQRTASWLQRQQRARARRGITRRARP